MDGYFWIITICACFTVVNSQNCKREQRCRISRVHGMTGADCYKKDLRVIPQCLSSNVEIIDLSYNRIRKVSKDDLKKYTSLKMLYLSDNAIVSIDEEAFEGKDDLNTLDLSLNAISKLPPVVFHLPSLKSLYLGQNLNMNIVEVIENSKPITSPLVQLDISYVMSEDPNELPDLGILPFLTKYNISGNKLFFAKTKHFAGLCNLKILDSSNVSLIEYEQPCHCWTLNQWLKARQVDFTPFECEINENECMEDVPSEDMQLYESCMMKKEAIVQKSRMVKIIIPIVVVAAIILIITAYCILRRRQKQKRKRKENRPDIEPNVYDTMLLNNKA